MNIEELAKQAGGTVMQPFDYGGEPDRMVITFSQLERFAALVAEECAKVCDELAGMTISERYALTLAKEAIRAKFKDP